MIDLLTEMEHLKRKKKKRKKEKKEWLLAFWNKGPNKKGSKERLFIMTRTHNMQIFGGNPIVQATKRHLNNR